MKRLLWLFSGVVAFSLAYGDDLGGLVRKTEGKKDNKPAPSQNSDQGRSSDGGNKPRPSSDSRGDTVKASSNSQDSDPFRKKPRNSGMVLDEPRRVEINSRPVLTDPKMVLNTPVPLDDSSYLPALVRRTEGLNPYRWNNRFVVVGHPNYFGSTGTEWYFEYRFGNIQFGYRYYSIQPAPYQVVYAPYWYYDPCPPFIVLTRVLYMPPPRIVYVEVPVFVDTPYYLERQDNLHSRDPNAALLADLRSMWMLRDIRFLERYVRPNSYIAVYLEGKYAYSISAEDYLEMTRDALRVVKTESIRFTQVKRRGDNQLVVQGEHRYIDDVTGQTKQVSIFYTFERVEGRWYLIEVGSSVRPIQ